MKIAPLNTQGVSSQNIYECAKLLFSPTPISRNDAAECLFLSSVTVGKVASAMLEAEYLSSEKLIGAKGRRTELYRASATASVLFIMLGTQSFKASLLCLDKTERVIRTRQVNESICYEDDIRVFLASLFQIMSDTEKSGIFSVVIVYEGKHPKALGIDIEIVLGCEPDFVIERRTALAEHLAQDLSDCPSLCVYIDERINYELYSNGTFLSKNATGHRLDTKDEIEIALEVSNGLASLFEYTVPTKISISSNKVTADKRFIELVTNKLYQKAHIDESDRPIFIDERNLSLLASFALDKSIEFFAKKLAGML